LPTHRFEGEVSCTPAATGVVHVPVTHDLHGVVQLSKQQTLSTQWPDAHSAGAAQAMPFALRQLPLPSHTCPAPAQVLSVCASGT
jgi:hypothetical protein